MDIIVLVSSISSFLCFCHWTGRSRNNLMNNTKIRKKNIKTIFVILYLCDSLEILYLYRFL